MEKENSLIRETSNIKETLEETASILGLPKKLIDFEILEEKEKKDNIGNIKKVYKIKVYPNENKSKLLDIFDVETDEGEHPLKAYIYVDTTKLEEDYQADENEIIEAIRKVLALKGINYGIKTKLLGAIAKEIKKRLSRDHKPFRVLIAEGKKPVRGENSKLIYHFDRYKAAGTVYKNGRIDYKNKNFLVPVKKGQLLVEFYKPTQGEAGYDVFGNILVQDVGIVIEDIEDVKFTEGSVKKVEEGRVIKIIAEKDGVIIFKNGVYDIDTTVTIDKVDIKTTGNLNAEGDVELEIGRGLSNGVEDTIAAGMKVKGKKVVVNGDVGPKATIKAEEVEIRGSVHKEAFIKAKKAKISICRGTVEADEIEIDLSEHAHLTAKNSVVINKAVATKIFAPKVEIKDVMMSSCITTSSDSVVINNIEGGDNIIAIKPLELPWIKEKYKELLVKEKYTKTMLKTQKNNYLTLKAKYDSEKDKAEAILKTIQKLKERGKSVPNSLLVAMKRFKELKEKLKKEEEAYREIENELLRIQEEIEKLRNSYKDGHIVVNNTIPANNIVEFNDKLKKVLETSYRKVKIYTREIQGKEEIVIEPLTN